jgi:hypothetical protein
MNTQPSWPLDHHDHLAEALREQGTAPEEIDTLVPALLWLPAWQAPQPSSAETQHLLARLALMLPARSPVRQAIRAHRQSRRSSLSWLLATARTQVSLFGLAFWLASALVTLVGAGAVLGNVLPNQDVLLGISGPFLAYMGTTIAFRGPGLRVLELELACLPSPWQLAIARLVIVLGYDVGLGLALSLALWAAGAQDVLALMLSWFMPLLLVAGLALLLSLRLSVQAAAALAYGSWLAVLALDTLSPFQAFPLTPLSEALMGSLGLALLAIALLRLHTATHRLLPRT